MLIAHLSDLHLRSADDAIWLERQLDLIDPKVVITLGKFAAQLLLDSKLSISKLRGRPHPFRQGVLIPTWHPAYALRGGASPLAEMRADFVRAKLALAAAGSHLVGASGGAGHPGGTGRGTT